VPNNNKQTYLTIIMLALQHQNGSLSIYHAMYLLRNEMTWKGQWMCLQFITRQATKPQLTMLGPLHSKSNALSNNLATQMCERDEEG
jgi:hypothetical protein